VIRADTGLLVKPEMTPDLVSTAGEWGGLQHASQMISRRFPSLSRGYMYHIPKALTLSLTHEASVMWEDELTEAATRGFRRSERGIGDIEMSWLVGFLRVERWREALLWSWAVARLGGESGTWDESAREEVTRVLEVSSLEVDSVLITQGPRKTLEDVWEINTQMGWESPHRTVYTFCKRLVERIYPTQC
jgi:3-O-alpha-D-mannopyranosyl-alpha-D-mannopyranose xylosylphosphotransferase